MSLLMDSGGIRRPNGLTKIKHLQEGGTDTKYFHLVANGKKNGFILCLISRKHDLSSQEELETKTIKSSPGLGEHVKTNHLGYYMRPW